MPRYKRSTRNWEGDQWQGQTVPLLCFQRIRHPRKPRSLNQDAKKKKFLHETRAWTNLQQTQLVNHRSQWCWQPRSQIWQALDIVQHMILDWWNHVYEKCWVGGSRLSLINVSTKLAMLSLRTDQELHLLLYQRLLDLVIGTCQNSGFKGRRITHISTQSKSSEW